MRELDERLDEAWYEWKQLSSVWGEMRSSWSDEVAGRFESDCMEPLGGIMPELLDALDEAARTADSAERAVREVD
jgi:hypothetical protein